MFFLYAFLTILNKCILFYGFMLDPAHTSFDWNRAFHLAIPRLHLYAAFILFLLSFSFLFRNLSRWYLLGINGTLSLVMMVDLLYVRAFNTLPTFNVLAQLSNLDNLTDSIIMLIQPWDAVFWIDLPVGLFLLVRYRYLFAVNRWKVVPSLFLMVLSLAVICYVPLGSHYFGRKDSKALFRLFDPTITCYNLSPIGFHALDMVAYVKEGRTVKLSQRDVQEIREWYDKKAEHLPDNRYKGIGRGKNLIMIQVESLENFVLNRKLFGQELTPHLNKILQHSLFFSQIYEQVNHGSTSDAEFMSNTSIYPLRKGSVFFRYPANRYVSLPRLLEAKGYRTMVLHADKGSYWNWAQALRSIGFQQTADITRFAREERIGMGLSDASFFKQALPMLKQNSQPFFSFLITMSSHSPYKIPREQQLLHLEPDKYPESLFNYLQSIRYVDQQLGYFFAALKKEQLLSDTIVVLYGDHEGVHKYTPGDMKPYPELANGKRVPFIVYAEPLTGKEIATIGGQIDMMPTIAYLMGIEEHQYLHSAMGRNLLKTEKNYAVLANGKLVGDEREPARQELYKQGLFVADRIIKGDYFRLISR
ncbi:LTA synthase family protein [Brevibacillus fulvus]|uniref:Phosphoglycerol transferase MdoB-like AlkP superfamily enzyme n=1 Tax=Brevibacillus fulvus TaxID=1125967 RepID=A0A939BSN7_9BACL|nr:LTA synthase family protein [Brevibacillus fulvus]MBM7590658.1 phosphoglycerol transferase MdoB-like AlkP superfamily enzyme [Brevibacillus fulvus]